MKKIMWVLVLALVALGAVGVGAVYAQGQLPPFNNMPMMGGGGGWMHDYVEQALAAKLGLTEQQVEDKLSAGQTMYQIALEAGTTEADIPALLTAVHQAAFDKAVADGVVSREQANLMLQRMQRNLVNGAAGNCPMHNGTYGPNNGSGFRGGQGGGMMGGGRWQNQ
jgi:hypothetical protein